MVESESNRPQPSPFYGPVYTSIMTLLQTLHANQRVMIGMLRQIITQESQMAIDLTGLTAEVAENTSREESVITLVNNLAAQIAAMPPSSDPATQAALDALVKTLQTNDQAIAAAVAANTH